ncbi:MAG TPA: DUF2867 domain-containing protein [Steroidobacteraceae bacterium]|nr:DUF2867 domain-containing protein [Steroidobacteraceae bacterium]
MTSDFTSVKPVALPAQSGIAKVYKSVNLADAFAVQLPAGTSGDPDVLWRFVMMHQPSWIGWLTNIRDAIVACFGLKTAKQLSGEASSERIAFFKVYSKSDTEVIVGEDDKHLDFRLSVLRTSGSSATLGDQLTVTTVVHCHNLLGRIYLFVIRPFHRQVIKASLRRAAVVGWPKASAT